MRQLRGDLIALGLAGEFDVLVHGANCMCTMGAGIAKAIRRTFPEAYEADCRTVIGDRTKLGTFTSARVNRPGVELTIVNAYTQFDWRGSGRKVDYDAVRNAMRSIARAFPKHRIGYPLLGAGLGGGAWSIIGPIIDQELEGLDHALVVFDP